jgi:hypothetical protein
MGHPVRDDSLLFFRRQIAVFELHDALQHASGRAIHAPGDLESLTLGLGSQNTSHLGADAVAGLSWQIEFSHFAKA